MHIITLLGFRDLISGEIVPFPLTVAGVFGVDDKDERRTFCLGLRTSGSKEYL